MQFEFVENDPEGEGFVGKLCVAYGAFENVCFEIFLTKKLNVWPKSHFLSEL